MKRALLFTVTLVALLVALTGCISCCIKTELRVTNMTGGVIQFYTGHTKKAYFVPAGATTTVPHTEGRVIVITQQDQVWEYDAVGVFDVPADTERGFKRMTLALTVQPDGVISLPSGKRIEPTQTLTPKK